MRALRINRCPQTEQPAGWATPQGTSARPVAWLGFLDRFLAHLLAAPRQRCPLAVSIQAPPAHAVRVRWRDV
jgi:hypothetical protein